MCVCVCVCVRVCLLLRLCSHSSSSIFLAHARSTPVQPLRQVRKAVKLGRPPKLVTSFGLDYGKEFSLPESSISWWKNQTSEKICLESAIYTRKTSEQIFCHYAPNLLETIVLRPKLLSAGPRSSEQNPEQSAECLCRKSRSSWRNACPK